MSLQAGDRIDRYTLLSQLGSGGQATVWKASDPLSPNAHVALKLLGVSVCSPEEIERLRREARQMAQLSHPSLVDCSAVFEDIRRDLLGVAMDFVDGDSTDTLLEDSRFTQRHRGLLLRHLIAVLVFIHQSGVVHRDIKLQNILVTKGFWTNPDDPQHVKLVDFGIASAAGNPQPLTQVGHAIGTPPYMAPECIEPLFWGGQGSLPAADFFAFGIVAWKLLVGGHPTGLPDTASLVDYASAYRRVREAGTPWPPVPVGSAWTEALSSTLRLSPTERAVDGPSMAQAQPQLEAGRRDDGSAWPAPAAVGSATRTPQQPLPRPALGDTTASKRALPGWVLPMLAGAAVMAVCFGVWLSLGEGGSTRVAQHPTTPSAAETTPTRQLPPPPPPPPPRRPPTCADGAELCAPGCCSSGRDCGEEGCGAYLSPNEYWDLRLWEIRRRGEDSKSRRITNGDIDVCVTRLRDNERVCVNRREVVSGFGKALPVSKADLTRHGLSIEVEERGFWSSTSLAKAPRAVHDDIKRSALCVGLRFPLQPTADSGVDSVFFYLDPPGLVRPPRCPN